MKFTIHVTKAIFSLILLLLPIFVGCHKKVVTNPVQSRGEQARLADSTAQRCTVEEVASKVNESIRLVNTRRDEVFCNIRNPSASLGSRPVVVQGTAPEGFTAWLHYVAEHIRTNTPFDSSYTTVAVNALDVSSSIDPTGDRCLNLHEGHDILSGGATSADPDDVGKSLFRQFSACDPSTREAVVQLLLRSP